MFLGYSKISQHLPVLDRVTNLKPSKNYLQFVVFMGPTTCAATRIPVLQPTPVVGTSWAVPAPTRSFEGAVTSSEPCCLRRILATLLGLSTNIPVWWGNDNKGNLKTQFAAQYAFQVW